MPTNNFQRTPKELRRVASLFWPPELSEKEVELSVIPKLLETQDQFIAILSVEVPTLEKFFQVVENASMSKNLFLKHLMVLSDIGGEPLQRINAEFNTLFPLKKLAYWRNGKQEIYNFVNLPIEGTLSNTRLGVDGKKLQEDLPLSPLLKDVMVILLYGSSAVDESVATNNYLSKCEIGNYIGKVPELKKFIKQRYIWVSRQTKGATSNSLGQLAQSHVRDYLEKNLNIPDIHISGGSIPGISHQKHGDMSFDIVVNKDDKYVALEVMFQQTTNSVIERKAGQAQARHDQIEKAGYKIGYVIDGVGSFARENALKILCSYSDCTVAFSQSEFEILCDFIRNYFSEKKTE